MGYGAQTSGGALVNRMAVFGTDHHKHAAWARCVLQNKSLAQGETVQHDRGEVLAAPPGAEWRHAGFW